MDNPYLIRSSEDTEKGPLHIGINLALLVSWKFGHGEKKDETTGQIQKIPHLWVQMLGGSDMHFHGDEAANLMAYIDQASEVFEDTLRDHWLANHRKNMNAR